MTGHVDRLERQLFQQSWDDGLLDVFAGVGVVGLGVCWALDLVALGAIVPAMLAPFWGPLRRALVEPRAGLVEFSDERVGQTRRRLHGSAWLGVVVLGALVVLSFQARTSLGELLPALAPAVPALLLGLLSAIAGLIVGLPRFMVYAALFAAAGLGVAAADHEPEVAMVAAGLVVLASGAWRLGRFLRLDVERGDAG